MGWVLLHGYHGLRADLWPIQIVPFAIAGALMLTLSALGHDGFRRIGWAAVLAGGLLTALVTAAGASIIGTTSLVGAAVLASAAHAATTVSVLPERRVRDR